MTNVLPSRNFGLDLVRVTEATAMAAARWAGSGNHANAHRASSRAMSAALETLEINGRIVIGEEGLINDNVGYLRSGNKVGTGEGTELDVVVDPIDGTNLLIKGWPGAISVMGIAPRNSMWSPVPAIYMEKIIVDRDAADVLVPECMDAPAAWTLALIARAKKKSVRDLTVVILDRPRHKDLIQEIRTAGARIFLRDEGDIEAALLAALPDTGVDILMGVGGASQGVITACAVRALDGQMLARLAPQSSEEREAVKNAGLDIRKVYSCKEMVTSNKIFFSATGITQSSLLSPLQFHSHHAETHSLLIRAETGTRRFIRAEHALRMF